MHGSRVVSAIIRSKKSLHRSSLLSVVPWKWVSHVCL